MIHLLKAGFDRLVLGLAAAGLVASSVWWCQQQEVVRRLRRQPIAAELAVAPYEPANLRPPGTDVAVWPRPPAQSHGPGWLYEVFTPPVIYYHALARAFTVTPPPDPGEAGPPFGLELLAVKPELFRLQLAGYFGAPGDYLAAFTSPQVPETLLGRAGRRFDQLGLTLTRFEVKKIPVTHDDTWAVHDVAAFAVLTDDRTGGEVVLDSRARKFTDTPLAVLRLQAGAPAREVHEGDTFAEGNSTYRIERIQLDPPEVVVARTTPGLPQPETRLLRPAAKAGGLAGKAGRPDLFSRQPATGLANSGK